MTLNLTFAPQTHIDFTPRITVIGVGGGGTNAVNTMISLDLQGCEFVVANTDAQSLQKSKAERRIQLGPHLTMGLGAGAKPEIGKAAAEEAADEVYRHLDGVHMVFITAGMGGGTGTGAAPVIARMARERGILTVGVVTKPFAFEGARRMKAAELGIEELQQWVDTLIVIPNQNLFRLSNQNTSFKEAFKMADNVLYMGVRGVTDLMVTPGMINLDFADIRTVMGEMGKAMMGTGEADGEGRALRAAELAINNPLLEDTSMAGARGLLINITGGDDMALFEVDQAANRIREEVDENANIIFGTAIDETLTGRIRVSVVATGIENPLSLSGNMPHLAAVGGVATPHPVHVPPMSAPLSAAQNAAAPAVSTTAVSHGYAPSADTGYNSGAATASNLGSALARDTSPRMVPPTPRPFSQIHGGVAAPAPDLRSQEYRAPDRQPQERQQSERHPVESRVAEQRNDAPEPLVIDEGPRPRAPIPQHLQQPLRPMSGSPRPTASRPAEPPRQAPQPDAFQPRKTLFSIVTSAIRGHSAEPAMEATPVSRNEPQVTEYYPDPLPTHHPQATINVGADIPPFLRKQT